MLLADHGTNEEKKHSRQEFVEAIKNVTGTPPLCDTWFEESAIHHLGIWEWSHERHFNACLFFLADVLICNSKASYGYLIENLDKVNPEMLADMKLILERIMGKNFVE
jgi:hypothetical protein